MATLDAVAKALGLYGGTKMVIHTFAPAHVRDQIQPDPEAQEAALKFLNEVTDRSMALSLVDQAVTDTPSYLPPAVEGGMEDLVKKCELKRETVTFAEGNCKGLRIKMEPIASGLWWDEQITMFEAEDLDLGPAASDEPERLIFEPNRKTKSRKSTGRQPSARSNKARK